MYHLKSLRLEALRGATQPFELKFERRKPITIVYGENGSGKSTICDAFDLLANEGLGSLEGRGLGSTSKYWHSTNRRASDIEVTLVTNEGLWRGKVARGKAVITPSDTHPRVAILRRHQIIRFVAGKPGDRYEAVRPFISIDAIDESERSLRDLINSTTKQLSLAEARTGENLQTIENVWNQAGSPAPSMLEWAEAEAIRDTADLDLSITTIRNFQGLGDALTSRISDLEDALRKEATAKDSFAQTEARLRTELDNAATGSQELTHLFQAASHLFEHRQPLEQCPLCGSREYASDLPRVVEAKLNALASLQTALQERDSSKQALDQTTSLSQSTRTHAIAAARELCVTCAEQWHADFPSAASVTRICATQPPASASDPQHEKLKSLSEEAARLTRLLEPELTRRLQRRSLLQTVRDALDQYHHNSEQKTELETLLPRLKRAHEILVEERREFVDDILTRIAKRVGELYEDIHPGEGLSKISLQLHPERRASLDVMSQFPGANESPPSAYLSESHLDTLGVCIFLALAELDSPDETILVLDDVVASVDEPHVDRIIEMVYGVAQEFVHCLLTTHYLPWREKYRWGWLQKGECQFIELGEWTWDYGLVTSKSTPRVGRLRALMEDPASETQELCACAGVVLEAILKFLIGRYECAVPQKRTKPTLGDLLPAINKKLRKALRVELYDTAGETGTSVPVVKVGEILEKLEGFTQIRNVLGCHFNELSFHLSEQYGREFGEMVLELGQALIHPDHGWPASDRSGEYWTNSGKSRRLYPLKQPS